MMCQVTFQLPVSAGRPMSRLRARAMDIQKYRYWFVNFTT